MPTLALLLLSCCMQPLEGIVPYNFQYGEAHDAMCQNIRLYEAGIDQGGKREDGFFHLALGQTDRLSRLQRPASHEDAKGTETTLLFLREQLITPGDGVLHGLLACWQVSSAPAQEFQTMGKPLTQLS